LRSVFSLLLLFAFSIFSHAEENHTLVPLTSPPNFMLAKTDDENYSPSTTGSSSNPLNLPWLTGPLLTPAPQIIYPGYFNIQPYLTYQSNIGIYDTSWENHSIPSNGNLGFLLSFETGLFSFMDITTYPQFFYNFNQGVGSWEFADLPIIVSFQLLNNIRGTWIPSIRFAIGEIFPTGSYQNLDPDKLKTDIGGQGTFQTLFGFVFGHLWHFGGEHYFSDRLALQLNLCTPTEVSGYNAYGGNASTKGVIYPGLIQNIYLGFEYTFTKNWALALDIASLFTSASPFKGTTGGATVGFDSYSYTLTLAPAIEYNLSKSIGFIGGVWFSVLGHNAFNFINGQVAANFFF